MVGCSTCGRELAYIAQYDRLYCYSCRAYAPRDVRPCPHCGRALVYVPQYQRYYCYGCQEYKQPAAAPGPAIAAGRGANPCPTCGKELTFIPQYNRHYCYNCRAYAPLKQEPAAAVAGPTRVPTAAHAQPSVAQPMVAGATREAGFTRQDLDAASKDQLMRWCQDYGLDASGMKYELRLRLMEYMKAHGVGFKGGPPNLEGAPAQTPAAAAGADTGNIVIEPITDEEEATEESAGGAGTSGEGSGLAVQAPSASPLASATPATSPSTKPPAQVTAGLQETTFRPMGAPSACPTCGGPLSYITQYNRFYCYRCQAYAPRDLGSVQAAARAAPTAEVARYQAPLTVVRAQQTQSIHIEPQQGNVLVGIYMILAGLILYGIYEFLYNFPRDFQTSPPLLPAEVGFALRFLGFLIVVVGILTALSILRQRTE